MDWRQGATTNVAGKDNKPGPPASTLWQGQIQVLWHLPLEEPEKQKVGKEKDLPWQEPFSLQVCAKAVHPYESMPSKLRMLPTGPQAPPVIVRMEALDGAPADIQDAARMYLDPTEPREIESSCVVLHPAVTIAGSKRGRSKKEIFEETCLKSLRAQPGTVLAMELPAPKSPDSSTEDGSGGPSASETLFFIPTPLPPPEPDRPEAQPQPPDAPMLACVNGSPAHVAVCAHWDPLKRPRRGVLARSLPPAPPHFQPGAPRTLHELESERRRLQAELAQLQKTNTSTLQHYSWREEDPLAEFETKEDIIMKELASIFGKILNQQKLESGKAGANTAQADPSSGAASHSTAHAFKKEKRARISWYDGGLFGPQDGSGDGDACSALRQQGLGLKRQAQQKNEGCSSKVARIYELEEAAAQKRKRLGNGAPQWLSVRAEDAEEDEDIKHWMGVLGPGDPWADMGPLGIDRGLLDALQSKVVLPGGLRAAAVVCLWRAAGYEHCRTGTSNGTAETVQAGDSGSRGNETTGDGGPEGFGGRMLMAGFHLPVRRKIQTLELPPHLSRPPEAQPCKYSIQEVLAEEALASQLASLGPMLPRPVFREMKGTKLLYLFPKQQLAPKSRHAANLGRMIEYGMDIKQASNPVSAILAYTGTELTYDVVMVPDQMAAGDPNKWLVKDLRGWLMTPVRVMEDRHFMSECLLAIEQAHKSQQHELQQEERPQVFMRLGLPGMELYPMGVQLVLNARTWLQSPALQLAHVCALLAAGAHLPPHGSWCIRMRRCHIEKVVAMGSTEAVDVLRLAWEAGVLLPLQQEEMSSNRAHLIPLLVRDTLKVAIHQRRAARFFVTVYPSSVPQQLLKTKQAQAKQQLDELQQNPEANVPFPKDEQDLDLAAHAGITPSILHGSIPEVQQFLHILLGGQAI